MADEVTLEQLKQAQADGAVVVDVRGPDEYAGGHIPGARSLPISEAPARMDELPRDTTVYLVCQGGGRSAKAADLLAGAGFDVRSVAGGTTAWTEAGGRIAAGTDRG